MRRIQQLLRQVFEMLKRLPRWGKLFAAALAMVLFFQACGSGTSTVSTSNGSDVSEQSADSSDSTNTMENLVKEHRDDTPTPTPVALAEPAVPVVGEDVVYATVEGQSVSGYLAQPEASEGQALPAIIAIHEWWGLNDNIKSTARRLAGEGYTVLAVDLYGGEVASEPAAAKDLMRSVADNPGPAQENIAQASQFLTDTYGAPAIGSIGWCFGGNWSLRTGLLLQDLDAMAIYYGQLILAPEALDGLDSPVIGFFGGDDSSIPVQDVENFEEILGDLGKAADINLYPGVGHAFANPSGKNYDPEAAEDAWEKTTAFFAEYLQAG